MLTGYELLHATPAPLRTLPIPTPLAARSQPAAAMAPKGGKPSGKVVTDSRFAAVHYDPRFQRFPKAKAKVEIDERFAGGCRRQPAAAHS